MQQPVTSLFLPRGLILLASVWLLASWGFAFGFQVPLEATSASYTPGVRILFICATIGLMTGWPLLRLTGPPSLYPIRQTIILWLNS